MAPKFSYLGGAVWEQRGGEGGEGGEGHSGSTRPQGVTKYHTKGPMTMTEKHNNTKKTGEVKVGKGGKGDWPTLKPPPAH